MRPIKMPIHLDWAAGAPIDPEAASLMVSASLEYYGNPSSLHSAGRAAKKALEEARRSCAENLGCEPQQLSFTSGGSESNAIIIFSRLLNTEPATILYSALEHPSIVEPLNTLASKGWIIRELIPEQDGRINPQRLAKALEKHPNTRLVTIMALSNEIGSIQPLNELAKIIRSRTKESNLPIHFHSDMVQSAGKIPLKLSDMDIDSASFSAHKFRGPRGIGLLYHRKPNFTVLQRGGGQESGIRPGTENVSAALAMALALRKYTKVNPQVNHNGERLLRAISSIEGARIIPTERNNPKMISHYAPSIIAVAFPPIPGELLSRIMAESGFAISTRSACSSNGRGKSSKALIALGLPKNAAASLIRISIGVETEWSELEQFLAVLREKVKYLRDSLL